MKKLCVLFLCAMCHQQELVYILPPVPIVEDEKTLNEVLKTQFAPDALETAYAYKQFWSIRVRLLVLEYLVDVARYEEAVELGNTLLLVELKTNAPAKKIEKKSLKVSSAKKTTRARTASNNKNVSMPKTNSTKRKVVRKPSSKIIKETLSESQLYKIYFYLAMAHWGLGETEKARAFFDKTEERPNYFYHYRYAQFAWEQNDWQKAHILFEKSYFRSNGNFGYINQAFAQFLVSYAVEIKPKDALMADKLLIKVLTDERLAITPAAAKAKIWWKQYKPLFRERESSKTPAFLPSLPSL